MAEISSTLAPSASTSPSIEQTALCGRFPVLEFDQRMLATSSPVCVSGRFEFQDCSTLVKLTLASCRIHFDVSFLDRLCLYFALSDEAGLAPSDKTVVDEKPNTTWEQPTFEARIPSARSPAQSGLNIVVDSEDCYFALSVPYPSFSTPLPGTRPRKPRMHDVSLWSRLNDAKVIILPTADSRSPLLVLPYSPWDTFRIRVDFSAATLGFFSLLQPMEAHSIGSITGRGGAVGNDNSCNSVTVALRDEFVKGASIISETLNQPIPAPFRQEGSSFFCYPHKEVDLKIHNALQACVMTVAMSLGSVAMTLTKVQYSMLLTFVSHLSLYEPLEFLGQMFPELDDKTSQSSIARSNLFFAKQDEDDSEEDEEGNYKKYSMGATREWKDENSDENESENNESSEESEDDNSDDREDGEIFEIDRETGRTIKENRGKCVSTESLETTTGVASTSGADSYQGLLAQITTPKQKKARTHKLGSPHSPFQHYLNFSGTVEHLDLTLLPDVADVERGFRLMSQRLLISVLQAVHGKDRIDVNLSSSRLQLYEANRAHDLGISNTAVPPADATMVIHTTHFIDAASSQDGFGAVQLAICIQLDEKTNLKTLTVVTDVRSACLHHAMKPDGENWLLKLIDFTDVPSPEYPVPLPTKMVRLHVHFRDLEIIYNPTHLLVCSLIKSKHAYVSSHIIPMAALSTLTFQFQETFLFLADQAKSVSSFVHGTSPLEGGYAQVMFDPYLKVLLQLCSDANKPPAVDVAIENESFEVDVCSDSMSSLIAIFQHYFNNGDLSSPAAADADSGMPGRVGTVGVDDLTTSIILSPEAWAYGGDLTDHLISKTLNGEGEAGRLQNLSQMSLQPSGLESLTQSKPLGIMRGDGSMLLREDENDEDALFFSAVGEAGYFPPQQTVSESHSVADAARSRAVESAKRIVTSTMSVPPSSSLPKGAAAALSQAKDKQVVLADLSDAIADVVIESSSMSAGMVDGEIFMDAQDDYFEAEKTCSECHRAVFINCLCRYHHEVSLVQQTKTNSTLLQDALAWESGSEVSTVASSFGDSRTSFEAKTASMDGGGTFGAGSPSSPLRSTLRMTEQMFFAETMSKPRSPAPSTTGTSPRTSDSYDTTPPNSASHSQSAYHDREFEEESAFDAGGRSTDLSANIEPRTEVNRASTRSLSFDLASPGPNYGEPQRLRLQPVATINDHFKAPLRRVTDEL